MLHDIEHLYMFLILFKLVWFRFMVFYAISNTISVTGISWQSVLLVEETGENHLPVTSH